MSIDAFEKREELFSLRAKLATAENSRLAGEKTFTLIESRQRLDAIYGRTDYPRIFEDLSQ